MLQINGEEQNTYIGKTLQCFLDEQNYTVTKLAVECNLEIVPKEEYASKILQDGDVIEVVSFVGGG